VESIWLWPLALVAVLFALPALRDLAARIAARRYRAQVREVAPDAISLVRVREPRWRNRHAVAFADRDLTSAGFAEAGTFVIHEMPELTVGLYALPVECAYAVIYDHPASGFWAELVTRYRDGSIANFTTLEPMDVELPEGSVHVAAPELTLRELWTRMRLERPARPMHECSRAAAAKDFERGYAESVARHKRSERVRSGSRDASPAPVPIFAPPYELSSPPATAQLELDLTDAPVAANGGRPGDPPDEELREAA
jgi:hypothetical protein